MVIFLVFSPSNADSVENLILKIQDPAFRVFTWPYSTLHTAGVADENASSSEVDKGNLKDLAVVELCIELSFWEY